MPAYYGQVGYIPTPEEEEAAAAAVESTYAAPTTDAAQGYSYVPAAPAAYTYPEPTTDAAQGYSLVGGPPPPPPEPGMYEPSYVQPGQYAPRPASTYYGGTNPLDEPGSPTDNVVQVKVPGLDIGWTRYVPGGTAVPGYATGSSVTGSLANPLIQRRGDLLGVWNQQLQESNGQNLMFQSAPPIQASTLTRNPVRQSTLERLAGLFGGGQQRSSQPMPAPPPRRLPPRLRHGG
jgi:hypothetical protein